jgi:hypothetical protein
VIAEGKYGRLRLVSYFKVQVRKLKPGSPVEKGVALPKRRDAKQRKRCESCRKTEFFCSRSVQN